MKPANCQWSAGHKIRDAKESQPPRHGKNCAFGRRGSLGACKIVVPIYPHDPASISYLELGVCLLAKYELWLKGKFELNRSGSVIWLTKWKRTESVDVWFDKLSLRWVTLVNMTGVCNSAAYWIRNSDSGVVFFCWVIAAWCAYKWCNLGMLRDGPIGVSPSLEESHTACGDDRQICIW